MKSTNFSPRSSRGARSSRQSSESTNPTLYSPLETRNTHKQQGLNAYTTAYVMPNVDARYTTPYTAFNNEGVNSLTGTFANYDPFGQHTVGYQGQMPEHQHAQAQSDGLSLQTGPFSTDIDPSSPDFVSRYVLIEADNPHIIAEIETELKKVSPPLLFTRVAACARRNHYFCLPSVLALMFALACRIFELLYGSFDTSITQPCSMFQHAHIMSRIFLVLKIAVLSSMICHRISCFTSLTLLRSTTSSKRV